LKLLKGFFQDFVPEKYRYLVFLQRHIHRSPPCILLEVKAVVEYDTSWQIDFCWLTLGNVEQKGLEAPLLWHHSMMCAAKADSQVEQGTSGC
jgi:hypothetical protein